jgi:tetratricopeptide (TPR) repeat protein
MEGELLPREHGNVADTLAALGTVLIKKGDLEGATTNHQEALAIRRKLLGTENADVADSLDAVALLHAARGDWSGAEGMLQAAVTTDRRTQGEDHPNVLYILSHLAWVLQNEGKLAAAESSRGESSALRSKHGDYSVRAWSESNYDLADVLQAQGKFPQAEPLLSETAEYLQQCAAVNAPLRRRGLERLVRFYEAWDRADPGAGKRDQTGDCKKKLDALDALMARK